jgi:glycoside hydrolase-like protein
MSYLGFDRSGYPGDAVMQSLWNSTPMQYVGLYLKAPNHGEHTWQDKAAVLRDMGWGFLPVYVGQQLPNANPAAALAHDFSAGRGTRDAQDAATQMAVAGFSSGAVVYLDIETGGMMPGQLAGYVRDWVTEVNDNTDYWAGVYCSFSQTAAQVNTLVGDISTWVFHPRDPGPSTVDLGQEIAPDPATSGYAAALAWQYRMSLSGAVTLTWTDNDTGSTQRLVTVDVDAATVPDPSSPTSDRDATEAQFAKSE